jgi:hypothetical protein
MYVSDEFVRASLPDIAADPNSPEESFCFRLAASSNEVGRLESEGRISSTFYLLKTE